MKKETLFIAGGYVLFMLVFFFIGVTKASFKTFLVVGVLTGFYALGVHWAKKILEGSKPL
jgi:hypothetical protein